VPDLTKIKIKIKLFFRINLIKKIYIILSNLELELQKIWVIVDIFHQQIDFIIKKSLIILIINSNRFIITIKKKV